MTIAYSYARFSSSKQQHGSSLERQIQKAVTYAAAHKLILAQTSYTDLGVSAFHGRNAAHGALSIFLKAVEDGTVAKGSILLVENFDRLSRAVPLDALKLFQRIIDLGIVLITLEDQFIYSTDMLTQEPHKLFVVLGHLLRAHSESKRKAEFAYAKIADRERKGQLPTTRVPTWMKFSADRKSTTLIADRAKVVKEIFDRSIDGDSSREITRDLNARKVPRLTYAKEWRQSAVSQLLKNPAVYGEFKDEIRYPPVITKARYLKAQQIIRDRTLYKATFRRSNPNNSLVGLSKCGHCGRSMRFLPRADGSFYMQCVGAADNGTCIARLFPFVSCETALIVHLTVMETNHGLTRAIYTEKHEQAQTLEAEIDGIKSRQERLGAAIQVSGDIDVLGTQLKQLQAKRAKLESELTALGVGVDDHEESVEIFSEYSKRAHRKEGDLVELRRKLKMAFVRVIQKVEFLNADKKKWLPALRLTYVNGRTATVDVVPFLPERTQKWIANGTYHRSDLKKR